MDIHTKTVVAPDPPMEPSIAACIAEAIRRGAQRRDLSNIPGAREQMRREQAWWADNQPAPAEIRDETIDIGARKLPIRLYRPSSDTRGPVILYLHGGGWCIGDTDTHDNIARNLSLESGFVVVSLDYSCAPEAPFPAAFDEVSLAANALRGSEGERLGIDAAKLVLGGDSAGANLALAGALALRNAGTPAQALALFYGAFDTSLETDSYHRFGDGRYGLARAEMAQFYVYYAPDTKRDDWRLAPLHADLADAPPCYLLACGLDVLRDDSLKLAAALTEAGVRFRLDLVPGATHGFLRFGAAAEASRNVLAEAGRYVRMVVG